MDVLAWLRGLGLEQHGPAFRDNGVDLEVLPDLTELDLEKLGVVLGHRKKLLKAIAALGASASAAPVEPRATALASDRVFRRRPALQVERRQLTVMFIDLVGSTALARSIDPEEMRDLIRAYQTTVTREIRRFEGHVAKFMGDGVLAYFGWPVAHEDAAEQAVRAGLAVTRATSGLNAPDGASLACRVGIATGVVVIGDLVGEGAAQEEAVIGETPNLAARLQALGAPGTVVLAESTQRLVGGIFELLDRGPCELKGFGATMRVFQAIGESRSESRFEALHAMGVTPLVGREQELVLLLDRWGRALECEGQVALLTGEPGIGKSRLIRALRERITDAYTPLSHYGSPHHTHRAFHPVISLLERAAGITSDDSVAEKLDKLATLIAHGVDDVGESTAVFATLLGIPATGRFSPVDLGPQQLRERTTALLVAQLEGLARKRPMLAIYEDAQWFDPSTLELLERIVQRAQDLPAFVVVTSRPGFHPAWAGFPHVTQLSLARLRRREGAVLVERVLRGKKLPDEIKDQIVARTDGVPLFVEEMTKAVVESGVLVESGDRFELSAPLAALAIPFTLQDSLMARLDRLGEVKEVAQIASVIGREFLYDLLHSAADVAEPQLRDASTSLCKRGSFFDASRMVRTPMFSSTVSFRMPRTRLS